MILFSLRCLFLLSLTISTLVSKAQDKPCKPLLKANRHKQLTLDDLRMECTEFKIGDRLFLLRSPGNYQATSHRKVTVWQSGKILAEFNVSGTEISDPVYHEYDFSGKLKMTDSLDRRFGQHLKSYLEFFQSSHVVSSTRHYPNGDPESTVYYSLRKDKDSIVKTWYSNRFPKSIRIKNQWESDSVIVKWDSTGILREHTNSAGTELYYPDGVLMRKVLPYSTSNYSAYGIPEDISRDTLIAGMPCEQKKTFYPDGILKSVEYYSNGEPCLTWSFYTPEGLFKNKVKKGPVKALEIGVGIVEAEYAPEIFTYVEQSPEYPGGDHAFRKEMEKRMNDLLCKSETELSGIYQLKYIVNESGEVLFHGLQGINADRLSSYFGGLFTGMPKWKPGKQNGHPMNVYFTVDVRVKEN